MVNSIILLWEYIFYDVYQTLVWRCSIRYKSLRFREEGSKVYMCVTDKQKVDKHNVSRWLHRIEAWVLSTSHIRISKRSSIQWRRFGIYGQWHRGKTETEMAWYAKEESKPRQRVWSMLSKATVQERNLSKTKYALQCGGHRWPGTAIFLV